ncbi:MAG: hypothetical protein PHV43_01630, partial [Candidatus Colwellbacteria bacterium]|nr:hypothetical protein [Candidatus Colwellbacteria bacterium]
APDLNTLFTAAVFYLAVVLLDTLRWTSVFNTVTAILVATALMNIHAFNIGTVFQESMLNLLFAIPLAFLSHLIFSRSKN